MIFRWHSRRADPVERRFSNLSGRQAGWTKGLKEIGGSSDSEGMTSRRRAFKSLVAASATTAILAAGAAPAAQAGKVSVAPITDTTTEVVKDTRISAGGRKVG